MFNPVIENSDITTDSFKEKPKIKIEVGINRIPPPIPTIEDIIPISTPNINPSTINSSPSGKLFLEKR